jgi:hypothetical protein
MAVWRYVRVLPISLTGTEVRERSERVRDIDNTRKYNWYLQMAICNMFYLLH